MDTLKKMSNKHNCKYFFQADDFKQQNLLKAVSKPRKKTQISYSIIKELTSFMK